MIGKLLFEMNKNFGKIFFGNPNTLYYNIFNKTHKKLIANNNYANDEIKEYVEKGFFKTKINSKNLCALISNEIKNQEIDDKKGFFTFKINDLMKKEIKKHINLNFNEILKKLERFYNSKVAVASVRIRRNFYIGNFEKEVYSNNYHIDHYVYNHFKSFINLMDVNADQGPLHFYSKSDTKRFLKINNYKSRSNYQNKDLKNSLQINSGKFGESIIVNTTECLHKAGYVEKGNYRDMLFITFITIPEKINPNEDFFYYDKVFPNSIWDDHRSEIIKIAKPKSLRKTLALFMKYFKNKLN